MASRKLTRHFDEEAIHILTVAELGSLDSHLIIGC